MVEKNRSGKALKIAAGAVVGILAILLLGSFLARRPVEDSVLRDQANQAAQAGRWQDAEEKLNSLADPNPADWLNRAIVAHNLNRLDVATEALKKIQGDGPLAAQAALWTGRVAHSRFLARPMEASLLEALRLDPKIAEARRLLVYLYGTQGRRVELTRQFEALAEISPLTFDLINHWCVAHRETINEPAKLIVDLEKFVANDPDDRWSRLGLASNLRKLNRYEDSLRVLAPLPDSDPDARACRVEIAFDRGDLDAFEKLLTEGPTENARLARLRGRLALRAGDGKTALKAFEIAERLEPNHNEAVFGMAQALRITGNAAGSKTWTDRADAQRKIHDMLITIQQNQTPKPQLSLELGETCEAAGYVPEAKAWYRLAISYDPLFTPAQQALFRLEAKSPKPKSP